MSRVSSASRHVRRRDAEMGGLLVVDGDLNLRNAHLALDLQVDEARDARHAALQLLGQAAQRIEIVAEDLERDLRPHARKHVVEPVRDRLADVDGGRQHGEARADVGDDLLAAAA